MNGKGKKSYHFSIEGMRVRKHCKGGSQEMRYLAMHRLTGRSLFKNVLPLHASNGTFIVRLRDLYSVGNFLREMIERQEFFFVERGNGCAKHERYSSGACCGQESRERCFFSGDIR